MIAIRICRKCQRPFDIDVGDSRMICRFCAEKEAEAALLAFSDEESAFAFDDLDIDREIEEAFAVLDDGNYLLDAHADRQGNERKPYRKKG